MRMSMTARKGSIFGNYHGGCRVAPQSLHVKTRAASHAVSSAPRCDWPRVPLAHWSVSIAH